MGFNYVTIQRSKNKSGYVTRLRRPTSHGKTMVNLAITVRSLRQFKPAILNPSFQVSTSAILLKTVVSPF
jgi:CRISPR/Cas system-associated endonuclease/helicase Cas3